MLKPCSKLLSSELGKSAFKNELRCFCFCHVLLRGTSTERKPIWVRQLQKDCTSQHTCHSLRADYFIACIGFRSWSRRCLLMSSHPKSKVIIHQVSFATVVKDATHECEETHWGKHPRQGIYVGAVLARRQSIAHLRL